MRENNWSLFIYFRYETQADEGFSKSPAVNLANWTRFVYNDYNWFQGGAGIYKGHYKQIWQANQIIHFVPKIEAKDNEEQKKLDQVIAQAKFIRAFDYFNLVIMFENLEVVLEPSNAGDNYEVENSEYFYNNVIIPDLKDAIENLPEVWTGADKGRITKGAAYALLGKVYMQMGKWQEAKNALEWLVKGEGAQYYGLMDNYADNFTHTNENNKESVFEIQFSDVNKVVSWSAEVPNPNIGNTKSQFFGPRVIAWCDGQARRWLVDEYKKEATVNNTVNGTKIDDRLRVSLIYPEIFTDFPGEKLFAGTISAYRPNWGQDVFYRKYVDESFKTRTDLFSPTNYRVIRYADVLLCYAECLAELGDLSQAISYVDRVRTRPSTNLPPLASSSVPKISASVNSVDAFLKRLQMERALELSLETVRWIDIKRWGLLETQEGIDELRSRDPDFNNFVLGKHHILPLPQFEVDNNPNLTQNPNY